MPSVFDFNHYKDFFNHWVGEQPKGGHGEYRRLAQALGVSTTMVSQVFKSDKELSLELACELCEYLQLGDAETNYFLLLVEYQRAGSHKLRRRLLNQIKDIQEKSRKLETRLKKEHEMSEKVKATFYSNWIYSGVRMLTDCESYDDSTAIAARLNLPRNQVQRVLDFLIENKLVVQKNGRLQMGPAKTHVGSADVLVSKHHQNWRLQGIQKMTDPDDENLFYTGPMNLSEEVAAKIRQDLPTFIEKIYKEILPSKSETVRCLNIDWFKY